MVPRTLSFFSKPIKAIVSCARYCDSSRCHDRLKSTWAYRRHLGRNSNRARRLWGDRLASGGIKEARVQSAKIHPPLIVWEALKNYGADPHTITAQRESKSPRLPQPIVTVACFSGSVAV